MPYLAAVILLLVGFALGHWIQLATPLVDPPPPLPVTSASHSDITLEFDLEDIRQLVREEIRYALSDLTLEHPRAETAEPDIAPVPTTTPPSAYFGEASSFIESRINVGYWTAADNDALAQWSQQLSDTEKEQLVNQLIQAVNQERLDPGEGFFFEALFLP